MQDRKEKSWLEEASDFLNDRNDKDHLTNTPFTEYQKASYEYTKPNTTGDKLALALLFMVGFGLIAAVIAVGAGPALIPLIAGASGGLLAGVAKGVSMLRKSFKQDKIAKAGKKNFDYKKYQKMKNALKTVSEEKANGQFEGYNALGTLKDTTSILKNVDPQEATITANIMRTFAPELGLVGDAYLWQKQRAETEEQQKKQDAMLEQMAKEEGIMLKQQAEKEAKREEMQNSYSRQSSYTKPLVPKRSRSTQYPNAYEVQPAGMNSGKPLIYGAEDLGNGRS
jgi:hypothetical protein